MAKKLNGEALLIHDAKRCFVYEYGSVKKMDGKITISKRLLGSDDIDFVDAIERREVEVENFSGAKTLDLGGASVDGLALNILAAILDEYETTGQMPERVGD